MRADRHTDARDTDTLILDGGIGSELQKRGAVIDPVLWSTPATLENPDILEAIHRKYIASGSNVITTNTFFSSKHNMQHAGCAKEFVKANQDAAVIARKVKETVPQPILVAGSVSTMPPLNRTAYLDIGPEIRKNFEEQIDILASEGVDLLLLEMIIETRSASQLIEACGKFDLPIWAGISVSRSDKTGQLMGFRKPGAYSKLADSGLDTIISTVQALGVDALGIMHTRVEYLSDALRVLRKFWHNTAYVYPNVGYFTDPHWVFPDMNEIDNIVTHLLDLKNEFGLSMLGGCCGTGPDFVQKLSISIRTET